ncbi:MAG: flippase-like domain-containing protein [Deltaproteobacteria bacterium]|nr:flippase-like domain-containing protein [Deltaproteobacteria bacterium]
MKKLISLVVTLVVTVVLILYAFDEVDFNQLGSTLAGGNYWVLIPFELMLFVFFWFNAVRWAMILRPIGVYTPRRLFSSMMIGFGGNNLLPARLGEILRAFVFSKESGQPKSGVLVSLFVERLLDVLAIFMFYLASVAIVHPFPESIRMGSQVMAWVLGVIAAGIFLFLRYPQFFQALWLKFSRWLPHTLRDKGTSILEGVTAGLSSLKSPGLVTGMVGLSLLRWALSGGMVWLSLYAYGNPISLGVCMIVVAVSALAVSLPSVPGFFGVIQAAFVFSLVPFGVDKESALAASILFLLAQWGPVTVVGIAYFYASHMRVSDVAHEMETP